MGLVDGQVSCTYDLWMKIRYVELTPSHWTAIESLFGAKGACGGCWCMHWRVTAGEEAWKSFQGDQAREGFHERVTTGQVHGILAFDGDEPVGWCTFGPRSDFPRIDRTRAYRQHEEREVWSLPCFFVKRTHRGKGIGRGLLKTAIAAMRRRRVRIIEAYPAPLTKSGDRLPAAFAFTGPLQLFEEAGFQVVQRESYSRPMVQLEL